jgi:hypothetical protein
MFSKRSLEGYLSIDHRATGAGALLESATLTCSHCQRQIILNPDRTRSRGYCSKCDHYVCDQCEAVRVQTGQCRTFKQVMDELEQSVLKGNING